MLISSENPLPIPKDVKEINSDWVLELVCHINNLFEEKNLVRIIDIK